MSDTPALIRLDNVLKVYGLARIQALGPISLSIAKGDFVAVRGPSGSGKSTLLNVIAGLTPATSGEVYYNGRPFPRIHNKASWRRNKIGFIFQDFYLYPGFTVLENVLLPMANCIIMMPKWTTKARDMLHELGLGGKLRQNINTLSTGERQRVCVARALLNDPEIILADEPTGSLDSKNTVKILEVLKHINEEKNTTVLMVTHDDNVVSYAKRQINILDGVIRNGS